MNAKVIIVYYFMFTASLLVGLNGKHLGYKGSQLVASASTLIAVFCSILLLIDITKNKMPSRINVYNWFGIDLIETNISLMIDQLTVAMLCIITIISFCAQIYSIEYMSSDPHKVRYHFELLLFTLFMIILVTSDSIIQLFIGWEGVGVCSYLLINFWYLRFKAVKASILAILVNKIGDLTLLTGISLIQFMYKALSFDTINNSSSYLWDIKSKFINSVYESKVVKNSTTIEYIDELSLFFIYDEFCSTHLNEFSTALELICILIVLASIGKSAQFGFHIWLPEAMEGPTPVSSLIHAATMVTAGVFLMLRTTFLFVHTPNVLIFVMIIGALTIIVSATIGVNQTDMKKVIAYSTCSQLGYLFMCCGTGSYNEGMYHLLMHAFFKALLFLTAGYVIHLFSNQQDIRFLGGLRSITPIGYICMTGGSLAIIGNPFTSGFYSKEPIIDFLNTCVESEVEKSDFYYINVIMIASYITLIITTLYSINNVLTIFFKKFNGPKSTILQFYYSSMFMIVPLIILIVCSITVGYMSLENLFGFQSDFWGNSFIIKKYVYIIERSEIKVEINITQEKIKKAEDRLVKLGSYLYEFVEEARIEAINWVCITLYICFFFIKKVKKRVMHFKNKIKKIKVFLVYTSFKYKFVFFNKLILYALIKKVMKYSFHTMFSTFDKGIIEIIGPSGIVDRISILIKKLNILQTGFIYHYLGFLLITMISLLYAVLLC